MASVIDIRKATAGDYDAIADVMFDAVRNGRSKYTEEQRRAWVPQQRSGFDWNERLGSQTILVAIRAGQIVGFMSLAAHGYIDFAYIRPSAQGTGVFRLLFEAIEKLAQKNEETRLWVHASLMAQPAFYAMGFTITKKETVEIGDQALDRFEMEKHISID
ncbi:N-acetyltransferase family protein [Planctomycetaceae bacterium SH139]